MKKLLVLALGCFALYSFSVAANAETNDKANTEQVCQKECKKGSCTDCTCDKGACKEGKCTKECTAKKGCTQGKTCQKAKECTKAKTCTKGKKCPTTK